MSFYCNYCDANLEMADYHIILIDVINGKQMPSAIMCKKCAEKYKLLE